MNGLRVTSGIAILIYNTFDHNFEIKNDFTKYLKESFCSCSEQHILLKYFTNFASPA